MKIFKCIATVMGLLLVNPLLGAAKRSSVPATPVSAAEQDAGQSPAVLAYDIQGVSLNMDINTAHASLLARGFKRIGPDGQATSQPPAAGQQQASYGRNWSPSQYTGELITYRETITERGIRPNTLTQHFRDITYLHRMPRGAARGDGVWTSNPDRTWFVPLFDSVCAYLKQLGQRDRCARTDIQLYTNPSPAHGLRMNALETEIQLRRRFQ